MAPERNGPVNFAAEVSARASKSRGLKWVRFGIAALSAVPWVGSVIAAGAALNAENEQGETNDLLAGWLGSHEEKVKDLEATLATIAGAAEREGEQAEARLEDPSYLTLVTQGFRIWDRAETKAKREQVKKILSNAAVSKLASDDMVRLFLQWIDQYDEVHFRVMGALHRQRGLTGTELWEMVDGSDARHDSAQADLFKLLLRDLSTGGVIRHIRETTSDGRQLKSKARKPSPSPYISSPLEGEKPYELTQLGAIFVGYALDEPTAALPG